LRSTLASLFGGLAAGLTTITGLGMVSAGAAIEPAITSLAALQKAARVPVLGLVPSEDTARKRTAHPTGQRILRTLLLLSGVLVLLGCLGAALFATGGLAAFGQ
jgi:hypothetical protein